MSFHQVTTYMQMHGPSTAHDMQPYLLKIRGIQLRKAFASIRCSSHQLVGADWPLPCAPASNEGQTLSHCKSTNNVRMSNPFRCTAQALQASCQPTATSLLSRNSHC